MTTVNCLRILAGRAAGSRIPLTSPPITLGRSDDNRVVLSPEIGVSRHHAELTEHDGVWSVCDLGSMNGTYVNGERVEWPRALHPGDQIKIASDVIVFEIASPADLAAQSAPPGRHVPSPPHSGPATVVLDAGTPRVEVAAETAAQLRILVPKLESVVAEIAKTIVGQKEILHSLMLALM